MRSLSLLLAIFAIESICWAQIGPQVVNYQGRITKPNGAAWPDNSPPQIRVRIFSTLTGGTLVWGSGYKVEQTRNGVFSMPLTGTGEAGSLVAIFGPAVFSGGTLYFEISVKDSLNNERILSPRQQIASVPWSLFAQTVSDESITTPKLATSAVTSAKIASDPLSLAKVSGGALVSDGTHLLLGEGTIYPQFMMTIKGNTSGNADIPGIYIWNESGQAILDLVANNSGNGAGASIGFYDHGPGSGERSWEIGLNSSGDLYTHNPTGDKVYFKYNGRVGIGVPNPVDSLDINGGINANGGIQTSGNVNISSGILNVNGNAFKPGGGSWSVLSDARLKKNVQEIDNPLDSLLKLHGVTFEYRDPSAIRERQGRQTGFIAQDVEKLFPQWVSTGRDGYKSVSLPTGFSAMTVEAVREQQAQIERLKSENDFLRRKVISLDSRLAAIERKLRTSP